MKKRRKTKTATVEKRFIGFVFFSVLIAFVLVAVGFVLRIANVEKDNPVLMSEDFASAVYKGSYFYSVDKVPENLTVIEMRWLNGARHDGESRLNQAFRERYIYSLYKDADGHRYLWVRDGDFYSDKYQWANWEEDYQSFDRFHDSYFYKER